MKHEDWKEILTWKKSANILPDIDVLVELCDNYRRIRNYGRWTGVKFVDRNHEPFCNFRPTHWHELLPLPKLEEITE